MTVRAWMRENATDERAPREPRLRVSLAATGQSEDWGTIPVSIHNISSTGMLLECGEPIGIDETIMVDLPGAPGTQASIVWNSGRFFGCEFSARLDKAALSAAQLQSAVDAEGIISPRQGARSGESLDFRLRRLRQQRGLTLAEFARQLGVSKPTVWAWEQARSSPTPDRYDKIAEVLGTTASALRSGRDDDAVMGMVDRSRRMVAQAYGVDIDDVRIMIEL